MSLPKNVDPSKSNCEIAEDNAQSVPRFRRLTAAGRSAIAVIELRGDGASQIVSGCFCPVTRHAYVPGQIRYGVWNGGSQESFSVSGAAVQGDRSDSSATTQAMTTQEQLPGESIVLTPCDEEHFEIHCHGGPAAIARIEDDLARWGAFSGNDTSAAGSGSGTLLIEEAEEVLSRCLTARIAALALTQVRGALKDWAIRWRDSLSAMNRDQFQSEAQVLMESAATGLRLAEPWNIVLIGPPNVGKSSLLNAIVGFDRSITLDVAGTTRDVLHADTVIDGLPLRFSDTAGIRESHEPIEQEGIARARTAASDADLLLLVSEPAAEGGLRSLPNLEQVRHSQTPSLQVLNKLDRSPHFGSLRQTGTNPGLQAVDVATNALNGDGIGELMSQIAATLSSQLPDKSGPLLLNQRQAVLVRKMLDAPDLDRQIDLINQLLGNSHR